jgi:hypothetical protein
VITQINPQQGSLRSAIKSPAYSAGAHGGLLLRLIEYEQSRMIAGGLRADFQKSEQVQEAASDIKRLKRDFIVRAEQMSADLQTIQVVLNGL